MFSLLRRCYVAVVAISAVSLIGCGAIKQLRDGELLKIDKQYHWTACGPTSISKFLKAHGTTLPTTRQVSREIRANSSVEGFIVRNGGVWFNTEAYAITAPDEIHSELERQGYRVAEFKGNDSDLRQLLDHLSKTGQSGIILSKDAFGISMHYEEFPKEDVGHEYPQTEIVRVFWATGGNPLVPTTQPSTQPSEGTPVQKRNYVLWMSFGMLFLILILPPVTRRMRRQQATATTELK